MNKEQIEAEIAAIRAKWEGKRGRRPKAETDRVTELMAMLEDEDMTDETTEAPSGMVKKRTTVENLCVPFGTMTRMVPLGSVVEVPASFADEMGDRLEDI